jgi:hypothetical protein
MCARNIGKSFRLYVGIFSIFRKKIPVFFLLGQKMFDHEPAAHFII